MKKLFFIFVVSLVWGGSVFANDIILNCKFINGAHFYENGTTAPISRSGMQSQALNIDEKYLINVNSKKILKESAYSKEFVPIDNNTDYFDIEWNDLNITWRLKYNYPLMKGQMNRVSLDRSTGVMEQISSFEETSRLRIATKVTQMKSNYNCEIVKKKF